MRYPSQRLIKEARKIARDYLEDADQALLLFDVASAVDRVLKQRGRVNDLFPSLFDYEIIIPQGWCCRWMGRGGESDSLYCVVPVASVSRSHPSPSLLTGLGSVHVVDAPD